MKLEGEAGGGGEGVPFVVSFGWQQLLVAVHVAARCV